MWYLYIIGKRDKHYTGITSDLENRLRQHGNPQLLYCEQHKNRHEAGQREKQIKGWSRKKKERLVAQFKKVSLPRTKLRESLKKTSVQLSL
jgi:putative endonuclease